MATKKQKPVAAPAAAPEQVPLPFETRVKAGDFGGARRLAQAALADGASPGDTKTRAQAVLESINVDRGQVGLWAAMLLILVVVFTRAIVMRNGELATMPSNHDVNKAIIQLQPAPVQLAPAAPAQPAPAAPAQPAPAQPAP